MACQWKKKLENALAVAKNRNDRLIDKPDLKSSMDYWHNQAARIGLTGAYSPHSLRYTWAQDAIHHYQAQGFSRKETLAMELGHKASCARIRKGQKIKG